MLGLVIPKAPHRQ